MEKRQGLQGLKGALNSLLSFRMECENLSGNFLHRQSPSWKSGRDNGQIVVEYVLLLVIAVSIAIIITTGLISRDPDNPGVVIEAWDALIKQIGADTPDDIQRSE